MKICSICKIEKEEKDFSLFHPRKSSIKLRPDCKECKRKKNRSSIKDPEKYKERLKKVKEESLRKSREFIENYLCNHPCIDCGISDTRVLDFDHLGDKKYNVSTLKWAGARIWKLEREIEKCVVRCANCHRIKSYYRRV